MNLIIDIMIYCIFIIFEISFIFFHIVYLFLDFLSLQPMSNAHELIAHDRRLAAPKLHQLGIARVQQHVC